MRIPLSIAVTILCLSVFTAGQQKQEKKSRNRTAKTAVAFVVNSPAETAAYDDPETDADESADGVCADASGKCTLTAATMEAENMEAAVTVTFQSSMTLTLTPGGGEDGATIGLLYSGSKILAGANAISINGSPFGGPMDMEDHCEITGITFDNVPLTMQSGNVVKGCTFSNTGTLPFGMISIEGSNNIIGGPNASDRNFFRNGKGYAITIAQSAGDGMNQIIGNYIGVNAAGSAAAGTAGGIVIAGNDGEGKNLIEGNVISGNNGIGIGMMSTDNNVIKNNKIGTDAAGTTAVGNLQNGILLVNSSSNTIEGNILSGNAMSGLVMSGDAERPAGSSFNIIKFNFIGVSRDTMPIPNGGFGVQMLNNTNDNIIGSTLATDLDTNVIAFNTTMGIIVWRDSTVGAMTPQRNIFRRNRMYANGEPGIILIPASQGNIARALMDSIQRLTNGEMVVHGTGKAKAVADVYLTDPNVTGYGEGKHWLGKGVITDSGTFAVNIGILDLKCDYLTILQTDEANNTSSNSLNYGLAPNMVLLTQSCEPSLFGAIPYANNKYSVHVDWKGLPKVGTVEFSLNGNTKTGTLNGDLAEVEYNMSQSIVGNNTLSWKLITCDNRQATGMNNYQFCGNPVPDWLQPVTAQCGGGHMKYQHTQKFPDVPAIAAGLGIPPSMAFVGGLFLSFAGAPSFTATLNIPGESEPIETNAAFSIGDFRTNFTVSGTATTQFAGCNDVDLSGTLTLTAGVARDYSYGLSFGTIPCPSIPGLEQACQMANSISHSLRVGATLSGQISGTANLAEGIVITGGSGGATLALTPFLDIFPFHARGTGQVAFNFTVPDFSVTSVTPSLVLTVSEDITGSSKSWTFPSMLPLAERTHIEEGPLTVNASFFPYIPVTLPAIAPDTILEKVIAWNARPAFAAGPNGMKAFAWVTNRSIGGKKVSDIMMKYFNGSVWMPAVQITNDDNVDRNPAVTIDGMGAVIVCWEKNSSAEAYPESLHYSAPVMKNYDLAFIVRAAGAADLIAHGTLGAPDVYDALPQLVTGKDGNPVLAWQTNNGSSMYGTDGAPSRIVVARNWFNAKWNQFDTLAALQYKMFRWDLAVHDEANAIIALAKDTEGDLSTGNDWEIFTIRRTAGVWGAEQRLTTNTKMEFGVNAAFTPDAIPVVSWMRDTSVIGSVSALAAAEEVWIPNAGMGFFSSTLAVGKDTMALLWNEGSSLVLSTSPITQRKWSTRKFIHFTTDIQRSAQAQFDRSGSLHIGYQQSPYNVFPAPLSDSGSLQFISLEKISSPLGVRSADPSIPSQFALLDAFPNPFNNSSTIRFILPKRSYSVLTVTNILGKEVARLAEGELAAGEHSFTFVSDRFASGIYFYTLRSGGLVQSKKMIMIK